MAKYNSIRDLWVKTQDTAARTDATANFHRAIHTGLHADGVLRHGGTVKQLQLVRLLLAMEDKEWTWTPKPQLNDSFLYAYFTAVRLNGWVNSRRHASGFHDTFRHCLGT